MIELRLLGSIELYRHLAPSGALTTVEALLRQPKRLTLLAYLCLANRGAAVRRDTVLAVFWPELDQSHARAALRQALHFLRLHVGEQVVGTCGDDLLVPPESCRVDAVAFDAALTAERWADAASLYRGPLLDGIHVAGTGEAFERWLIGERARLHEGMRLAIDEIGRAAEEAGKLNDAVRWARRAVELDPLREAPVRRLMRLLHRLGDHDELRAVYGALERRLLHERGAPPSAATAALVAELEPPLPVPAAPRPTPPAAAAGEGEHASPTPLARDGGGRVATRGLRSRVSLVVSTIAGALLLSAALYGLRTHGVDSTSSAGLDARLVVVAPFRTGGADPELGYLREGMLDLLAARLTGDGGPRAAEPRTVLDLWTRATPDSGGELRTASALAIARELGSGRLLLGGVVGTPRRLVLTASLLDAADGEVRASASAAGPEDSLTVLVDRLAVQLLVRDAGEAVEHRLPLDQVALPAIHAYLAGQAAYRHGEFARAASHFEHAIEIDSTFALAALGLVAATWGPGHDERGPYAQATAWALRHRLSPRDRALLTAYVGPGFPERASWNGSRTMGEQLAVWEHARDLAPDRAQPWYEIGDILLHWGSTLGVPEPRAVAANAFARAVALDPLHSLARDHLLQLALLEGDTAAVRRLAVPYFAHDPAGDDSDYLRWHVALALDDRERLTALRARFDRMNDEALGSIIGLGQQLAWRYPEAIDDAERAAAALRGRSATGMVMVRLLDLNRGRPTAAVRGETDATSALSPLDAAAHALYWDADPAHALPLPGALAHPGGEGGRRAGGAGDARPDDARLRDLCMAEQWRLAHGETGSARDVIRLLEAASATADPGKLDPTTPRCAALLDAMLAVRERRPDARAAVDHLDALLLRNGAFFGSPPVDAYASNLVLARLRATIGELDGALEAVRRRSFHPFHGSIFLSSYLREEARLAARAGDRAGAIRAYRHYLLLRADPEPALRAEVARVRAELARLENGPAGRR